MRPGFWWWIILIAISLQPSSTKIFKTLRNKWNINEFLWSKFIPIFEMSFWSSLIHVSIPFFILWIHILSFHNLLLFFQTPYPIFFILGFLIGLFVHFKLLIQSFLRLGFPHQILKPIDVFLACLFPDQGIVDNLIPEFVVLKGLLDLGKGSYHFQNLYLFSFFIFLLLFRGWRCHFKPV